MPIYMDRHDVPGSVTAEMVAELHVKDLHVQNEFCCRAITYWFDDKRKTAFCLIEAPNAEAIQQMHDHAHGQVPHSIIEVDPAVVESFLGRIEDPENTEGGNVISEPAFRVVLMARSGPDASLPRENIFETAQCHSGSLVSETRRSMLYSFRDINEAFLAGRAIMASPEDGLTVAIATGLPLEGDSSFFAGAIHRAGSIAEMMHGKLTLSAEASALFSANGHKGKTDPVALLTPREEETLETFLQHLQLNWQNADLSVADFTKPTGMSRSKLYRTLKTLTGRTPSEIIDDYRLARAAELLEGGRALSVAEIAYATGYSSPSYFSKCFRKRYRKSPSAHLVKMEAEQKLPSFELKLSPVHSALQ